MYKNYIATCAIFVCLLAVLIAFIDNPIQKIQLIILQIILLIVEYLVILKDIK